MYHKNMPTSKHTGWSKKARLFIDLKLTIRVWAGACRLQQAEIAGFVIPDG